MKVIYGFGHSLSALSCRIAVLNTAAGGLASTGRVYDSLGGSTWMVGLDHVDQCTSGAKARRHSGLTSTKDVNAGA